jgi:hypothetical protein
MRRIEHRNRFGLYIYILYIWIEYKHHK